MNRQPGFTLIEVMVVVAIIAILASIALPSYAEYVVRGKVAEAAQTLADLRTKQEQFFLDNRSYVNAAGACGTAIPAGKYFSYACAPNGTTQYVITATGAAAEGMGEFTYTIDEAGNRSSAVTRSGWSASATCWQTKKGGVC